VGEGGERRLRSLDVFRGLTMAGMAIVNNPGDWNAVYWPLLHAEWHGWTPTDLIFPFFLFIVGVAIPCGSAEGRSWPRILRRTAVIIGLGWFLAGFPFFRVATWRIPGVLPRIGLCYLVAAALVRVAGPERRDVRRASILATTILLAGYWILLTWVPVPGGAAGDLSPSGNLGAWLDRTVLGGHLWRKDWDPEGLLSTLPASATTLLGVLAGVAIGSGASPRAVVRGLSAWGLSGVLAGLAWHVVFPINKALWTSSYVLFTGGMAAAALAGCYAWVDAAPTARSHRWSEPLVALGRNALALFILSGLVAKTLIYVKWPDPAQSLGGWLYVSGFAPFGPPKLASLAFAVAHLVALWGLLWWLHRRRLYWTA
jgi:predicted acyltransferase